jgi:serine protease Do
MHRSIAGLLVTLTSATAFADVPAATTLTPTQIASRSRGSVVLLRLPSGLGSGFVIDKSGRIATNLHVLGEGGALTALLPDGREVSDIEVLATDGNHDLAVLRVRARDLAPLPLADSDRVQAGDRVVAIGHPLGLENTVSDGLISAVRKLTDDLTVLQISAPISPGSSGGPLFNERGEVIGISTLIATAGQNLNFAIPINALRPLLSSDKGTPIAKWHRAGVPTTGGGGVRRHVPHHELAVLAGCSREGQRDISERIENAIDEGAPSYNEGHHQACYRTYESTAREIDRKVSGCVGVRRALMDGVRRADGLGDYTSKAWAMRDAFDGVLELIDRGLRNASTP